jgi:hypothetical protein
MGFAERLTSPYVHQGLLLLIGLVLAGGCLIGAVLLRRRAPAVSTALSGAAVAGTVAFFASSAHHGHGVPHHVGLWASIGLWVGWVFGLFVMRRRPPSRPLWRVALTCLALAPFGAALLLLSVQRACPLYVTRGAGYCFYGDDVLGGWAAGVTFLFILDMVAIAAMLLATGRAVKEQTSTPDGDAVVVQ